MADMVLVCAKTNPEARGADGISLFMVEEGMAGFERGRKLKKIGMAAQDTSELFFDEVRVPKANLLGKLNGGFKMLMYELPQERLLIADMGVAAAEAMYELTRQHVKERKAFGKPLLANQVVAHHMADMKQEIVVARHFIDRCLELLRDKALDAPTACMAKNLGAKLQCDVADKCLQLHGGAGYMQEYAIAKYYVDARVQRIYGGSEDVLKEVIARSI